MVAARRRRAGELDGEPMTVTKTLLVTWNTTSKELREIARDLELKLAKLQVGDDLPHIIVSWSNGMKLEIVPDQDRMGK